MQWGGCATTRVSTESFKSSVNLSTLAHSGECVSNFIIIALLSASGGLFTFWKNLVTLSGSGDSMLGDLRWKLLRMGQIEILRFHLYSFNPVIIRRNKDNINETS